MATTHMPPDGNDEKALKANIQRRFQTIFSGKGEPLTDMSLRQVEALKAYVAELEAQLSEDRGSGQDSSGLTSTSDSQPSPSRQHASISSRTAIEQEGQSPNSSRRSDPTKPESNLGTKRPLGLRSKLTFAITITSLLAVLALSYFAYLRANQTQTILGGQLETSVKESVGAHLTSTVNTETLEVNSFLEKIAKDIDLTANYASQLLRQEATLGSDGYWNVDDKLVLLPAGQRDNPNSDPGAVFIPKGVPLTGSLKADLATLMHLDLVGPSTLRANTDMVALYYINPRGVTIYYPNADLANLVPPDFDVTSQVFYQVGTPKNNPDRKNVWTPPYQDPAGTGLIVTNVSPIYDERGTFRGVLAADVQLAQISKHIADITIGKTGYAFLIDDAGHIIAMPPRGYDDFGLTQEVVPVNESPKQSLLDIQSEPLQQLFQQMISGANSLARVDLRGSEHYVAYGRLAATGYRIALVVPVAEMNEPVIQTAARVASESRATLQYGALLLAMVLLGSVLVSSGLSRVITSPLEKLTYAAQRISAGQLDQTVTVTSSDEVGLLSDTFNKMTTQLRELFTSLEQRVEERTHDLQLASEVGRTLTARVHDLDNMLTEAAEMIRTRFGLYYTQIYLLDPSGKSIILRAGTGEAGKQLLQRGHRLSVNSASLNGRAVTEKCAVIVTDSRESPNFLPNPLLPDTRSEMAIPLMLAGEVVGVLDMQSAQPGGLNENNLPAFEALAAQLAVAIQNAALLTEAETARAQMEGQARRLTKQGWQDFLDGIERGQKIGYAFDQSRIIRLKSESLPASSKDTDLSIPIKIIGTKIGEINLPVEENRAWTANELDIIKATSAQLAQHIENLRLLAQAEQYRAEAEQAVRRLTREGWESYKQFRVDEAAGYMFDLSEVRPVSAAANGNSFGALKRPLVIRDEMIGELTVGGTIHEEEASEIVTAVAEQLSAHIENLRLLEEAEQRRLELHEGEARLRTLVENAPEAILVVDLATGLFTEPNENATKLYGLSREDLVKVGPAQMSPPTQPDGRDSTEKAMEKISEAMAGGAPVFDWTHRNSQGQDIPCEVRLVRLPGDRPLVRASVTDITERKRNQEILAQRAEQLETVATLSTTASTVLDPDKLLQAVVDLTKERFKLYHSHIYLADASWKTLLLAAGAGEIGRRMVAQEHAISMDAERSLVARAARERHSVITNDVRNQPDFLPNPLLPETRAEMAVPMIVGDQVLGVFDVQSDTMNGFSKEDAAIYTTLASQVAVALQNARLYVEQAATVTQLRELDRLKSSFLANMSHELRTPLNSILGFADVMLEELDGPLTENMNTDLTLIQKNGQHLLHLINDVLDMAKIEAGRMNLQFENFNLHETIEEVASITSLHSSEKDIALYLEPDSDRNLEIKADRTRVRQVMINLINNAVKFTDKGSISIRVARDNNDVLISVKDTGNGIPPSHLESVFQEFTQVDTSATRKVGGTGLGLPISRRLIEMHGGRLWAESTGIPGEGSTFFILLPIEAHLRETETQTVK